jgi:hypothetical protein
MRIGGHDVFTPHIFDLLLLDSSLDSRALETDRGARRQHIAEAFGVAALAAARR